MAQTAVELTTERINKIKEAATQFRNSISSFFKEHEVEVKDWKFAVENSGPDYIVDVSVKVMVKPKPKH